jgi:hypothetical protein
MFVKWVKTVFYLKGEFDGIKAKCSISAMR